MESNSKTIYRKDLEAKKIFVKRYFDAPLNFVWKAWTEAELLDQWWAPKPWKAETKSLDFKVGGHWLYAMCGPDQSRHWSISIFTSIQPQKSFSTEVSFCDEAGNRLPELTKSTWQVNFKEEGNRTCVDVELTFENLESLQQLVEMGFEQGFAMAHGNLDEMIQLAN